MAPAGILSFGHCSSFKTWEVTGSPKPMSVMATKMDCVSPVRPVGSAFRFAITSVMPIDATRPQPRANNNKARDLGRIGLFTIQ